MNSSTATTVLNNRNSMFTNYDTSKVFIRKCNFETGNFANDGYDDVTLGMGTLMGRISATGDLTPLVSGASDGSQYPVGILAENLVVEAGNEATINICIEGEVDSSKLILDAGDTLSTVIDGRQLRDRINADTLGIKLTYVDELSGTDNQ